MNSSGPRHRPYSNRDSYSSDYDHRDRHPTELGRRFQIYRCLGAGGMGTVYDAYDAVRDMRVALKVPHQCEPDAIYHFKREFRAIVDLVHPNLVSLYELLAINGQLCMTMELIDGVDVLTHVRQQPRLAQGTKPIESVAGPIAEPAPITTTIIGAHPVRERRATTEVDAEGSSTQEDDGAQLSAAYPSLDVDRLRADLIQLAQGLEVLHASGHLHRDIKPSNVLVERHSGRLVLLDFGGIAHIGHGDGRTSQQSHELVGTPGYMAPEICFHGRYTPAGDWFAVGALMYEAFMGRLPGQNLEDSGSLELSAYRPGLPDDLANLCMALLQPMAKDRPSGEEVLARLRAPLLRAPSLPAAPAISVQARGTRTGAVRASAEAGRAATWTKWRLAPRTVSLQSTPTPQRPPAELVGRQRELAVLDQALRQTHSGRAAAVLIRGEGGIGKSSLASYFLERVGKHTDAVILRCRCYVHESLPFAVIDGLIDDLCQFLRSLPEGESDALLPGGIDALAHIFPVLHRVDAVSRVRRRLPVASDPAEHKRQAQLAFRECLARISERWPLLIHIDDAQWGDADSVGFLERLLKGPDMPPLLMLVTYRGQDPHQGPFVRLLREQAQEPAEPPEVDNVGDTGDMPSHASDAVAWHELTLGPLLEDDAIALSWAVGDSDHHIGHHIGRDRARDVVRETRGNPFFLTELLRFLTEQQPPSSSSHSLPSLQQVILRRVRTLSPPFQRLIEIIALAGKPLRQSVVVQAARVPADLHMSALQTLAGARLARLSGPADDDLVEVYHDRIREALLAALDAGTRRRHHRSLAMALEHERQERGAGADASRTDGGDMHDAEELMHHWTAAGEGQVAARCARSSGDQAVERLAFERAAHLYRQALDLGQFDQAETDEIRISLGGALAKAGRCVEAAELFLHIADTIDCDRAVELRARASEYLLRGGYVRRGIHALERALADIDIDMPSKWQTWARVIRHEIQLPGFAVAQVRANAGPFDTRALQQIDVTLAAALGLSAHLPLLGSYFHAVSFQLTREVGEPRRLSLSLFAQAFRLSTIGEEHALKRARAFHAAAYRIGKEAGLISTETSSCVIGSLIEFQSGDFVGAEATLARAERLWRGPCSGEPWELSLIHMYRCHILMALGRLHELDTALPEALAEADAVGDRMAMLVLRADSGTRLWLARGQVERVRAALKLTEGDSEMSDINEIIRTAGQVLLALYTDDLESAQELLDAAERRGKLVLRHIEHMHVLVVTLRAGVALRLAQTTQSRTRNAHLRKAASAIKRLRKFHFARARPQADLASATLAFVRMQGQTGRAWAAERSACIHHLSQAATGFAAMGMDMHMHMARFVLGYAVHGRRDGDPPADPHRAADPSRLPLANQEQVAAAQQWFADHDIRDPARYVTVIVPGMPPLPLPSPLPLPAPASAPNEPDTSDT